MHAPLNCFELICVRRRLSHKDEAKQLLLLVDTDKKGKVSKQEWMKFMEAEFDRLDKAKTGYLDIKELMQSKLRVSQF
jgi:Ca2+-binding EF-hand superfamily protein